MREKKKGRGREEKQLAIRARVKRPPLAMARYFSALPPSSLLSYGAKKVVAMAKFRGRTSVRDSGFDDAQLNTASLNYDQGLAAAATIPRGQLGAMPKTAGLTGRLAKRRSFCEVRQERRGHGRRGKATRRKGGGFKSGQQPGGFQQF